MAAPHYTPAAYEPEDRETALKYAVERLDGHGLRVQLIEGEFDITVPTWDHERAVTKVRRRLDSRVEKLGCLTGSGDLDLPGSLNWYVPDIAVVPEKATQGAKALPVSEAWLVVEVTSESNAVTDRVVKRRRYGQYGVPLYLLVDRIDGTWTLFSDPTADGYATEDGPHRFGTPIALPAPFSITLDTSDFRTAVEALTMVAVAGRAGAAGTTGDIAVR